MNCQEVKQHLLDYEYGELEAEVSREVEAALEDCPECQQELEHLRTVRTVFREAMPEQEVPHLVHANILREARRAAARRQEEQGSGLLETLKSWLTHPSVGIAAAAMMVIIIAIVFADNDKLEDAAMAPMAEKAAPMGELAAEEESAMPADEEAPALAMVDRPEEAKGLERATGGEFLEEEPEAEQAPEIAQAPVQEGRAANEDVDQVLAKNEAPAKEAKVWNAPASPGNKPAAPVELANADSYDDKAEAGEAYGDDAAPVVADAKPAAAAAPPADEAPKADPVVAEQQEAKKPAELFNLADNDANSESVPVHQSASNAVVARRDTRSSAAKYGNSSSIGSANQGSLGNLSGGSGSSLGGLGGGGIGKGNDGLDVAAKDARTGSNTWDLKKTEEIFQNAKAEEKRGNAKGAIQKYNEVVSNTPRGSRYHEEALYHRGVQQKNQQNHDAAIASFREVLAQYPSGKWTSWARYNLAQSLLAKNPGDKEAEQILADLARGGGGGVANKAEAEYIRQFGKRGAYDKKAKPSRKAVQSKRKKAAAPKMDFEAEDSFQEPAEKAAE